MNRTKSSIKNVSITMLGAIVTMLLQLINRRVFVNYLASDYLGLNGLFSDILSMLSLSELGIGAAMVFALYKPVAEKDYEKIKSLMQLYKKYYTIIGCFVLGVGIALTPFLKFLIKEMPNIPFIHLYYIMYVVDSGMSYFYTYKRSLIICNREDYISSMTTMLSSVGMRMVQLLVLVFTHNYFLFLLVQIIFTRVENIVISKIAEKKYPYLREKNIKSLDAETKEGIKKNIFAMVAHKIGNVVVNGTDNIIVSKILGLSVLGIYSNYHMLIITVSGMVTRVFNAITSNIGNLVAEKNAEDVENVFYNILFMNYWIYAICTVCFSCLLQPFVRLWLGPDYLLSDITVLIIVTFFYFGGVRNTVMSFRDATGMFWHDRYKALIESVVNIAISIPLAIKFGVAGVKLGTLIAFLCVSFWVESYVLFKYFFNKSIKKYMLRQMGYALLIACICFVSKQVCLMVDGGNVITFAVECVICIVLPNVLICAIFFRTREFQYFWGIIGRVFQRFYKRKEK